MPKTIAELRQELQDAGRDVRMAGEMVERLCDGTQDVALLADALAAVSEARGRTVMALIIFDRANREATK